MQNEAATAEASHPFTVTEGEVTRAVRYQGWRTITKWQMLLVIPAVPAIMIIYSLIVTPRTEIGIAATIGTLGGLAGFLGGAIPALILAPRRNRRNYRKHPYLYTPGSYAITPTAYKISLPTVQMESAFSGFIKWDENAEFFLLYFTKKIFQMVPKRNLVPGDADLLRSRLQAAGVPRW